MKIIIKFDDYVNEAEDVNKTSIQNNTVVYNKYKNNVISIFNNKKPEDADKINEEFEKFITGLPENEKGASDLLRTLFSSEKLKFDIKGLEIKKKEIDEQITQRMNDLRQISANIK